MRSRTSLYALLWVLTAAPAFAQQGERPHVTIAYERTRDRFHYRFENPSKFSTEELVPHEFTQTYWADNDWLVARAMFNAGARLLETEAALTPQRSTRGDDYDTFFEPSGDVVVVGTTGGISIRAWRVQQTISVARKAGVDWAIGYRYRQDRSEFHPGLRSVRHSQPASYEEEWIYSRETTISRTYGIVLRPRRSWSGSAGRVTIDADVMPAMTGRLTTLLPDKYPGQAIVFSALAISADPKVTFNPAKLPITLSVAYNGTLSYLKSRQFVRQAVQICGGLGF